ncbi:hypothetical protein [Streptomyces lanatus]|uniref:Uncharacterized protein n=1 Tax=Streptomyces lanatus TaxID=66900 RepID=A0ABV1Y2K7_9ACTN|nr:hypothetical protein [Streptomyces lanatus]GHH25049.1 hypothetical protein GCM10018780_76140 [Streptomyces lanatus]
MCDERLEAFSRERLGGRPVPEDVRVLATAQWEGRGHPFEQLGITVLEPGALHPLTDHSYLSEEERADPDIMANCAASEQMATYLKAVAQDEDGNFYGYWLHPQQRETQPPPVIKVDTELTYSELGGRTFSEACLYDIAFDDDELFVTVAAELAQLDIRIPARSREDLDVLSVDPAPEDMHMRLFYAEQERLGRRD